MFDMIQTALDDARKEAEDAVRRLQRENGQLKQSIAVVNMPADVTAAPAPIVQAALPVVHSHAEMLLAQASIEWHKQVREPLSPGDAYAKVIDGYIRGTLGLGWSTTDYHTWKPDVPYMKDLDFAWCGAFASFCYGSVGLRADIRKKYFAGTDRLYAWVRGTARLIARWQDLLPGDVMVVGVDGKAPGSHITLVRLPPETAAGRIPTYEGNAFGDAPPGAAVKQWQGVVTNVRPAQSVKVGAHVFCYGVRPLPEDYV